MTTAAIGADSAANSDGAASRLLTGWGRTAASRASVHRPRVAAEVERLVHAPGERGLIARGLGRSYGDAAQNAGGAVLAMGELASIHELDLEAGEVSVDAGVSLAALIGALVPLGWFLRVSPGTRYVSVGGAIASDIHGKNHHRDGSFCDHVVSFTLLAPSGERLEVTPHGDPDAFGATAGGMGLTGVIVRATLRLLPVQTASIRVDTERANNLDDVLDRMERGDAGYRYSVAWIDCLAGGGRLGRSVLIRGDHARLDDLPAERRSEALRITQGAAPRAPAWMPSGLLGRTTVGAFNELYFRRAPREERGRLRPLAEFFYPLDGIRGWNRLYGERGFLQYQLVVPFGAEQALREALERLSAARVPSFLAVLKRFGPASSGLLSFPIPGWTLALDIPAGADGLAQLLDGLDGLVAAAGGRVYLAKDSRLRPDLLEAMYPEVGRWREIRARLDPDGVMRSDLGRRLGLCGGVEKAAALGRQARSGSAAAPAGSDGGKSSVAA